MKRGDVLNKDIKDTIKQIVKKTMIEESFVELEASGRHVHLSREAIDYLFGEGYQLTKSKELSQPGQFSCQERVTIKGPKGTLENVVVLGPERKASQVEVSLTDANVLGKKIPVRESGYIDNTPSITLMCNNRELELEKGLIIAQRHIHVSPEDAEKMNIRNNEIVQVKVFGERPLIFDDVIIRISKNYRTFMHIDFDEANACGFKKGMIAKIIKKGTNQLKEETFQYEQELDNHETSSSSALIELKDKIISENILRNTMLKNVYYASIPKDSIITPLAEDYVRKNKIKLQRSEENAL